MWRIAQNLFLGDWKDAHDFELLVRTAITHILNCAREIPCWFPADFTYYHLELTDPDPEFHEYIDTICAFIHRGRKHGAVLVHCRAGLSRSPTAVLAYLCHRGKSLEEALEVLRRRVGEAAGDFVEPDASFLEQLEIYFEE